VAASQTRHLLVQETWLHPLLEPQLARELGNYKRLFSHALLSDGHAAVPAQAPAAGGTRRRQAAGSGLQPQRTLASLWAVSIERCWPTRLVTREVDLTGLVAASGVSSSNHNGGLIK